MGLGMTPMISAFARAYHARQAGRKVFVDPLASCLLGEEDYRRLSEYMAEAICFLEPDFQGTKEEALHRVMTRLMAAGPLSQAVFSEEALRTEVMIGTGQYVILGAGLDSFIYRREEWAGKLRVFLLDRQEALTEWLRRAGEAGLKAQGAWKAIPADISQGGWIERLTESAEFSKKSRTFVSMMGMSYYLEGNALEGILKGLGDALPEGSAMAFDYLDTGGLEDRRFQGMLMRIAGEPMRAGYDYDTLETLLSRCGFHIYEHATPEEIEERFFRMYNLTHARRQIRPMPGINYCLAVRKHRG